MKKLVIGVSAFFLLFGAAVYTSYAQQWDGPGNPGRGCMAAGPGMMHRGGRGMHFLWRNLQSVGLTDKQQESIRAIRDRAVKDSIRQKAELQIARVELRELLYKDAVDMNAVEAKLKKTEALRTELHLSHIKAMQEIKAVLTPEQRTKFKESMNARFSSSEQHFGPGAALSSTRWDEDRQAAQDPETAGE